VVGGAPFAATAAINELALRDRPAATSRFGPTDPLVTPPACDAALFTPRTAHMILALAAEVDRRSIGSLDLRGVRAGDDLRWGADVATARVLGRFEGALVGGEAWEREPRLGWTTAEPFEARCVMAPRSIMRMSRGARPALMTWPPIMHNTARPARAAPAIASTTAMKLAASRSCGSESRKAEKRGSSEGGFANAAASTLFGLRATGTVRMRAGSISGKPPVPSDFPADPLTARRRRAERTSAPGRACNLPAKAAVCRCSSSL